MLYTILLFYFILFYFISFYFILYVFRPSVLIKHRTETGNFVLVLMLVFSEYLVQILVGMTILTHF